jgi:hypothetical protein
MNDICLLPGQATPLKFHTQPSVQFLTDPSRQRSFFALLTNDQDVEMESAEDFSRVHCHPIGTLFQVNQWLLPTVFLNFYFLNLSYNFSSKMH